MRMMILSFMMLSGAACAGTGGASRAPDTASSQRALSSEDGAHAAPPRAEAARAEAARERATLTVEQTLAKKEAEHPRGVERLRRELFVLERGRKLDTIEERIAHLRSRARALGVQADQPLASAITDLTQRHAVAREQLAGARAEDDEDVGAREAAVDAAIADLDVRSGQLALRLAFTAMN